VILCGLAQNDDQVKKSELYKIAEPVVPQHFDQGCGSGLI
jgi:hypothetical protein